MSRNTLIALCLVAGVAVSLGGPTVTKREAGAEEEPAKQPKITYSKETFASEHEQVKIDCAVEGVDLTGVKNFKVSWNKIDEEKPTNSYPITTNDQVLLFSSKFAIEHPEDTYQYTLVIKKIEEEDAGLYRCTVDFGDEQRINADVPVKLKKAPYFTDNLTKTLTVTEGDAISIDCQPGGSPKPDVYWERINQELPYYGGKFFKANQFNIPLIERSHKGHYVCYADNGIGNPANSHIILEVQFAPDVAVEKEQVFASTSESVVLTCSVEAHPVAEVAWYKEDYAIFGDANRKLSKEDINESGRDQPIGVKTTLTINEVTGEDFGTYTCKGVNTVGKTERTIEVRRKSPPKIINQSRSEVLYDLVKNNLRDALPVVIECEADGDPAPDYRWNKNGELLVWQADPRLDLELGTGNLLISDPALTDNGLYQCFAYNELGTAMSDPVYLLNATSISFPDVTGGQDSFQVEAELGRPFKLSCPNAEAYPEPTMSWVKAITMDDQIELQFVNDERVVADPFGNLWFTHVTPDDATTEKNFKYMCLGSTSFEPTDYSIASVVELAVIAPKDGEHNANEETLNVESFEMYTSPAEVTFRTEEENTLWCIFGGEPAPSVNWRRTDGVELDENRFVTRNFGRTLVFQELELSDRGEYECTASNGVGESKTATMVVEVEQAPTFVGNLTSQTVEEGSTVTFTCEADSTGDVTYTWLFNGRPISSTVTHPRRVMSLSSLVIEGVTMVDIGNYACNASSDLGYAYGQATLNVIPGEHRVSGSGVSSAEIAKLSEDIATLRDTIKLIHSVVLQHFEISKQNREELYKLRASQGTQAVIKNEDEVVPTTEGEEQTMMDEATEEAVTESLFNR